jgi:hypothetical protein
MTQQRLLAERISPAQKRLADRNGEQVPSRRQRLLQGREKARFPELVP